MSEDDDELKAEWSAYGWCLRDTSNQVFWPSEPASSADEALEALANGAGEWKQ